MARIAARTLADLLGLDPPGAEQILLWYRDIVDAVQQISAWWMSTWRGCAENWSLIPAIPN